jgi:hypothetical protein
MAPPNREHRQDDEHPDIPSPVAAGMARKEDQPVINPKQPLQNPSLWPVEERANAGWRYLRIRRLAIANHGSVAPQAFRFIYRKLHLRVAETDGA